MGGRASAAPAMRSGRRRARGRGPLIPESRRGDADPIVWLFPRTGLHDMLGNVDPASGQQRTLTFPHVPQPAVSGGHGRQSRMAAD